MNTTWIEIKKFIRYNSKRIFLGTLILGTLIFIFMFFLNRDTLNTEEESVDEIEYSIAFFQYYVERPDGVSFTNQDILRNYFTRNEILNDTAEALDVPLEKLVLQKRDEFYILGNIEDDDSDIAENTNFFSFDELINMGEEYIILNITKEEYSHLFTFTVSSIHSELNLKTAEYYYEYIENDLIPFYQDKKVYIFETPQFKDEKYVVDESVEVNVESLGAELTVTDIIVSYLFSFILIVGIYIIKSLFSKTLIYSFSYLWEENHSFLLIDSYKKDKEKLMQFLSYPLDKRKIYLSEKKLSEINKSSILSNDRSINKEIIMNSTLANVNLQDKSNEIVIIVVEGETSRRWYKEQQNLLSIFNTLNVKIVQINKD